MGKGASQEDFVKKSNNVHNFKYDYTLSTYVNAKTKINIKCPVHGVFNQTPDAHINSKQGCPKCAGKHQSMQQILTKLKHKNLSFEGEFVKYKQKVQWTCNTCNYTWSASFDNVINKNSGCMLCSKQVVSMLQIKNHSLNIKEKFTKIHGNRYDYSQVDYLGARKKVRIICNKHGEFTQTPNKHLSGEGCPYCSMSRGEKQIQMILDECMISYEFQYRVRYKDQLLIFDFYVPSKRILIEYNGEQHYKKHHFFHKSNQRYTEMKYRDSLKKQYARAQEHNLHVIKYDKFNDITEIIRALVI
jgi:hypothetical protein